MLLTQGARYAWVVLAAMVAATIAMQRALIARDFAVLFVAEKQPALDVVKSRLEAVGLSSFCLDLHSGGDSQSARTVGFSGKRQGI